VSKQLGQFLNATMNFVLSLVMSVAIGLMLGGLSWQQVVLGTLLGTFIGYVFGDLVPVVPAADGLAGKLHLRGAAGYAVSCAALAVMMGTVISFLSFLVNLGFTGAFWSTWTHVWLPILGIAFLVLLVVRKPIFGLAFTLFAPEGAAVPAA
jgi:purine-cytosine permease-like protein